MKWFLTLLLPGLAFYDLSWLTMNSFNWLQALQWAYILECVSVNYTIYVAVLEL